MEQSLRKTVQSFLKRLKIKNMIQQFHSWAYIQKNKSTNSKDTCILIFIVALLTIAKMWRSCQSAYQQIEG